MVQAAYSDQFYRIYANALTSVSCAVVGHSLTTQLINKVGLENLRASTHLRICCYCTIAASALQNNILTLLVLSVIKVVSMLFPSSKASEKEEGGLPPYMKDLTEKSKMIEKCPYSGFDNYISQLEVILCQKEKNNGILVGLPGIGKSAIFETLAWKIAHNQLSATSPFAGKRLISVSIADLVAGTNLRGDVETRIKTVIKISEEDPSFVFFIDEIHKLVGAGSSYRDSNNDIANQLKPSLARPGLRILGATTPLEYKEHFERDPTLSRRFKRIDVQPPSFKACLEMLQSRRAQDHYIYNGKKCQISDNAFKAAIFFGKRDNRLRQLPDVANDLIDDVCARECLKNSAKEIEVTEEMIMQAHASRCPKFTLQQLQEQFKALLKYTTTLFTASAELESLQVSVNHFGTLSE